ncbi:hypothetical protein HMPREF1568_1181 [Providencia alcalifaciens PAL-3]|nr:hypothetical protein HMPREF1568_1181 [Providencia alcalifaciens PAL-3]EUD00316.1 hypothetical protein HMPREF1566_1998 [Providencia alcalifaciens PAL-1]
MELANKAIKRDKPKDIVHSLLIQPATLKLTPNYLGNSNQSTEF